MNDTLATDGWCLESARDSDLDELMNWFDGETSVRIWGGPKFRYPFDRESFIEDSYWGNMATFCLRSPANMFSAFGQLYERDRRINKAQDGNPVGVAIFYKLDSQIMLLKSLPE